MVKKQAHLKRKSNFKVVSLLLTVMLIMMSVPSTVFAQNNSDDTKQLKNSESRKKYEEIEELRGSNVKHFQKEDGSYEMVVYTDTVHRQDENGQWVNIDNRLKDNGKNQYVTENQRVVFDKEVSSKNQKIFDLSEDGYGISFSFT